MTENILPPKKDLKILRYPTTENRSLKAWNAADELLLQAVESLPTPPVSLAIFNDRFGFLTCQLWKSSPTVVLNFKSQEKAISKNLEANNLKVNDLDFILPLDDFSKEVDLAILKIPKSLDLFRLQLFQLSKSLTENATVLCGFMTKYFSPKILEIAGEFFEEIEQSKAWKKSRVLTLRKKKAFKEISIIHSIPFEPVLQPDQQDIYQQYFGVFSAKNIDYASQFFIENLRLKEDVNVVLDLASGNGILSKVIKKENPLVEIHLMDDSYLAVESSKLNLAQAEEHNKTSTFFHFSDSLDIFEDDFFDLVVSNPPFHFEHETNIEVALGLFRDVRRVLKPGGNFQLVASHHLNFKTHLVKIFNSIHIVAENDKFIIYTCR